MLDLNRGGFVLDGQRHNILAVNLPGRHPAFYAKGCGRPHRLAHGHTGSLGPNAGQLEALGRDDAPGHGYAGTSFRFQRPERDPGHQMLIFVEMGFAAFLLGVQSPFFIMSAQGRAKKLYKPWRVRVGKTYL